MILDNYTYSNTERDYIIEFPKEAHSSLVFMDTCIYKFAAIAFLSINNDIQFNKKFPLLLFGLEI